MTYEELLEKVREAYESEDTPHVVKAWLLANIIGPADENEDERIRKELIEHIKANKSADYVLFKRFSPDDVIAWLEKQGKKLDADDVIKWLNDQACQGWIEDVEVDKFVEQFRKDFGL